MEMKKNNKGFSLVELIIVIAIMAVLMAVLAPQFLRYVERSRLQSDNTAIGEIANACKVAATDEDVAAEITAAIINITSMGGAVGCNPKTNVNIARPTPPITPRPIPPKRAPMIMATKTNKSCNNISMCFYNYNLG